MSPVSGHGGRRYPKQAVGTRPRMVLDGQDLGPAMSPSDVYVDLRHLLDLDDDEIIEAFRLGAAALVEAERGPGSALVMGIEDEAGAIEAALAVTRSRVTGWRRRARQMTWPELRVLLLGLRALIMGGRNDNGSGEPEPRDP